MHEPLSGSENVKIANVAEGKEGGEKKQPCCLNEAA